MICVCRDAEIIYGKPAHKKRKRKRSESPSSTDSASVHSIRRKRGRDKVKKNNKNNYSCIIFIYNCDVCIFFLLIYFFNGTHCMYCLIIIYVFYLLFDFLLNLTVALLTLLWLIKCRFHIIQYCFLI